MTIVTLDCVVGHTGFAKALLEVGWLIARNGSLEVPNFDRHLSESAKKRAESLRRKRKQRENDVTKMSHKKRDKPVTREREESKSINTPKPPLVDEWIFPKCLDSDRGKELISQYVAVQKNKGRHDPIAFQSTLSHLASFGTRKAMGLLSEWIETGRFKPSYEVNWEPYAPAEDAIPRPAIVFDRRPRGLDIPGRESA